MQRPFYSEALGTYSSAAPSPMAGEIVKSMVLPEEYSAIRMKDAFTNVRTAVSNPFDEIANNWTAPDSSGSSYMGGFLFRDTLLNAMIFDSNPTNSTYTYQWSLSDGTTSFPIPANSGRKLAAIYASATTTYKPHGTTLWNQFDQNGDPYFWCDSDSTSLNGRIDVTVVGAMTGSATLYKYDGSQGQEVAVQPIAGAGLVTFDLAPLGNGLYRVEMLNDSATNATFSVQHSYLGNSVWQQLVMPGYEANINNVTNIRIIGGALKWRNTTSDQYVNGRVACVQYGKGQSISEVISGGIQGMFSTVSSVREGVTRDFKKGWYGFLKPAEDNDLEMRRPLTANTPLVWSGGTPASKRSGFLAFVAVVTSGSGAPATNTQMRRTMCNEYQTNNLWAEVRSPSSNRQVWEQACSTIALIPQWHENPTHFFDIISAIAQGGAIAAEQVAPILRAFDNDTANQIATILEKYVGPGLRQVPGVIKKFRGAPDDDDAMAQRLAVRRKLM